jgi:hypothetical protein
MATTTCTANTYDLTTQQTVFTHTNTEEEILLLQGVVLFGDGSDNLDGSGGDFEFTLQFGENVNQPDPQYIYFSSATRASVFTESFPLPLNSTVTFKVKSPNAGDTSVYVKACVYEVGVDTIKDDIADLAASITALSSDTNAIVNVYDTSQPRVPGIGRVPTNWGTNRGTFISKT